MTFGGQFASFYPRMTLLTEPPYVAPELLNHAPPHNFFLYLLIPLEYTHAFFNVYRCIYVLPSRLYFLTSRYTLYCIDKFVYRRRVDSCRNASHFLRITTWNPFYCDKKCCTLLELVWHNCNTNATLRKMHASQRGINWELRTVRAGLDLL